MFESGSVCCLVSLSKVLGISFIFFRLDEIFSVSRIIIGIQSHGVSKIVGFVLPMTLIFG